MDKIKKISLKRLLKYFTISIPIFIAVFCIFYCKDKTYIIAKSIELKNKHLPFYYNEVRRDFRYNQNYLVLGTWAGGPLPSWGTYFDEFKARCLFQGEYNKITKMVIAQKGSDRLEDGYAVFGCKYGRDSIICTDFSIDLPYCDNADFVIKKAPADIFVDFDQKGKISISKIRFTEDELMAFIEKVYSEKGKDVRIFILADKNASEGNLNELSGKIKETGFNPYRVFLDVESRKKSRFVCVAKRL
jgi:biopolymer transport protein ExbD